MQEKWTPEKKLEHSIKQKQLQKKLAHDRMRKAGLKPGSKMVPHPDNAGTRYKAFPIPIKSYFHHVACYQSITVTKANEWIPVADKNFVRTNWAPGSIAKIVAMRERLENGQPLFHDDDRIDMIDYDPNLPGAMPVRRDDSTSQKSLIMRALREMLDGQSQEVCGSD